MRKKLISVIAIMMVMATAIFADVWQIKVKSDGKWKTQTISKKEFIQLHDSSNILSVTESVDDSKVKIPNYLKTVSYEVSVATLPGVQRVKLVHYHQKGEKDGNVND